MVGLRGKDDVREACVGYVTRALDGHEMWTLCILVEGDNGRGKVDVRDVGT